MSAEIRRSVQVLSEPDSVVELRALKNGTTAAGYFDNPEAAGTEAAKLEEQGFTVYATLNPVKTALLARAANKIKRPLKEATSDKDVSRRRWLLVDADPVLPAGISSTDEEKQAAFQRAREVYGYLREQGWPEPVAGDSGNGAHLLYAVDLPNDAESLELVKGVLEALSFKFSDGAVKVDTSVSNAGRVSKLYGTTARKGDSTKDRPHRASKLLKVPEQRIEVSREQLQAVAALKPETPKPERRRAKPGEFPEFDLEAWISEYGVPVKREGPWQQGYRYILEECPWNGHTDNACYIVQFPSGAVFAGCQHDSCRTGENRWRELRKHYEPGAYEYGRYERNGHDTGPRRVLDGGYGILLSEVVPERVRWLWEGRIALGKLNLVDGDPGTGKSAATTDLAARVSVGKPWPDGSECEAGGVVILSAEDGLADTIRPRFDAAGGDPSKAVALSTVPDAEGNERQISIPDDLHIIEAAIERVGAVLIVIDPLMAFLPGEVNSHRDQDIRRALAPLARLAERTGAAVVVIRHLNKATGGNALYRGGGSIGIVGAARSGLLIAKHPEDDGRRVLASIKSNLAAPAPSLVFALSSTQSGAVRVDWKGESNLDASALLSAPTDNEERSALSEAQEFLREVLGDGPLPSKDVENEGRDAGIEPRTLKRAKQQLGIISERQGGIGERGKWYWRLPTVLSVTKRTKPKDGPLSNYLKRDKRC
ncbi:MAG: AAA family ATPase [Actinomycetota bacterium]|nr:AAA family ATPase [Actinomycetota bacterium]